MSPTARHRWFPPGPGIAALTLAALTLAALTLTGCASSGPSLPTVQADLERQLSAAHFEPQDRLSLGRFSLGLARKITHLALDETDEDEARALAMLDSIRKVDLATYRVRLTADERRALTLPDSLERVLRRPQWHILAAVREGEERSWILTERRADQLRSLWVVFFDGRELGLVHLQGRLDRLLKAAFEADPEAATAMLVDDLR